ncbi:unnamed protein product [Brassica rapa subsp. trilocularis]|uniref:(rape) hypothetical protein n=1 Tax=Brassica napus TaxID=3708 RepID=A0A816L1J1_BRANA|nr:unnamed protein product [Brassica napus]CAF2044899.1 unnamed protein product [Brassica napus]
MFMSPIFSYLLSCDGSRDCMILKQSGIVFICVKLIILIHGSVVP